MLAHPHLQKKVTTKVGDNEVSLNYFTAPANLEHVKGVAVGSFTRSFAQLSVATDLDAGGVSVPAGDYTVGTIRKGESDWQMALYPGQVGRGESPDTSKLIKLNSSFSTDQGTADHIYFDILPGVGKMEGKTTLIWHFGPLYLAAALD